MHKAILLKFKKSYHIDICLPKFSLYSWMDRAKKTNSFRLWNFWKRPFQAKDIVLWRLTPICNQYQLLMVIAWLPDLLLTWVPYQWMEQVKLLISGIEIFEKVHSRPEIWSFKYEHSKMVKIGWGLPSLNGRSSASRGASDLKFCTQHLHAQLLLSPFGSLAKLHSRPEIWVSKHKLLRKWFFLG